MNHLRRFGMYKTINMCQLFQFPTYEVLFSVSKRFFKFLKLHFHAYNLLKHKVFYNNASSEMGFLKNIK